MNGIEPAPRFALDDFACQARPSRDPALLAIEPVAVETWGDADPECDGAVDFVVASDAAYLGVIRSLFGGTSADATCGVFSFCDHRPVVLLRASCAPSSDVAIHELAHYFEFCATGDADAKHSRQELWGVDGFVWRAIINSWSLPQL